MAAGRGVFMISVAAELAEMHPQTLRMYEQRGLITPKRSAKGTRLYSQDDVERLRRIQQMTVELGMNLAGVERVLEMEAELERQARRIEQLERKAARLEADLDDRRRGRAPLVPGGAGPAPAPARFGGHPRQTRLAPEGQLDGRARRDGAAGLHALLADVAPAAPRLDAAAGAATLRFARLTVSPFTFGTRQVRAGVDRGRRSGPAWRPGVIGCRRGA